MNEPFDAVVEVLQIYLDGLHHSDTSRLRRALHPQARYVCASDDELVNLAMEDYYAIVERRPSPASRNEPRRDSIVAIEFAGPRTAFARVHCAIGSKYFTDLLTLIQSGGRWQIIAKVFHYDIDN